MVVFYASAGICRLHIQYMSLRRKIPAKQQQRRTKTHPNHEMYNNTYVPNESSISQIDFQIVAGFAIASANAILGQWK